MHRSPQLDQLEAKIYRYNDISLEFAPLSQMQGLILFLQSLTALFSYING